MISIHCDEKNGGTVGFRIEAWSGFRLEALLPALRVNGELSS